MLNKFIIGTLAGLAIALTGCTSATSLTGGPSVPMTGQNGVVVNKTYNAKLYRFDSIFIEGPFTVNILTHQPTSSIQVIGNRLNTDMLNVEVNHRTLYIRMRPEWIAQRGNDLLIKIAVPDLKNIRYAGPGNVSVEGMASLRRLYFNGSGNFSMYWIDSPFLSIRAAGSGHIFIGGKSKTIDAVLSGTTYLDAKYLHAERGFINTTDKARADVAVSQNLNALASGMSNIYYYQVPALLGQYMRDSGSVLNMTGLK